MWRSPGECEDAEGAVVKVQGKHGEVPLYRRSLLITQLQQCLSHVCRVCFAIIFNALTTCVIIRASLQVEAIQQQGIRLMEAGQWDEAAAQLGTALSRSEGTGARSAYYLAAVKLLKASPPLAP